MVQTGRSDGLGAMLMTHRDLRLLQASHGRSGLTRVGGARLAFVEKAALEADKER